MKQTSMEKRYQFLMIIQKVNTIEQLTFFMLNKTFDFFPYAQALYFEDGARGIEVKAISAVSTLNDHSPYVRWLQGEWLPEFLKKTGQTLKEVGAKEYSEEKQQQWQEHLMPYAVYFPFDCEKLPLKRAGIIFMSNGKWLEDHLALANDFQLAFEHAYLLLKFQQVRRPIKAVKPYKKWLWWGGGLALILLFFLPVKQTIVAPAEVAPKHPYIISSSLKGFIASVRVRPNQLVQKGDILFELDQITLKNQLSKAENALKVAQEKYRQSFHQYYRSEQQEGQVLFLKAAVETAENDVAYQKSLLRRSVVRAPESGSIIFSSIKELLGKPVKIGQEVMILADANKKQLDIRIPASDMLQFDKGDTVRFYPNVSPMRMIYAKVDYASTQATVDNLNELTFLMVAEFGDENSQSLPRLGSHGTAKIEHGRVSLFYYLFRRPIIYLRGLTGW